MRQGRPKLREIVQSDQSRRALQSPSNSRSLPHGVVRRADIILRSAAGESNTAIARGLGVREQMVGHWRNRFLDFGIAGCKTSRVRAVPRNDDEERVARLLDRTLRSRPKNATHWSVRSAANATGIPKTQIHRDFTLFGLQPHHSKSYKLPTDPLFVDKVRDIVGLHLNPPDIALVLCVDEKSRIQALERSQPVLPMGLGYVEGVTHGYYRHGTTTLLAALNAAGGNVIPQCHPRHRHQEVLALLPPIDRSVPGDLDVHLVVDNYGTHKHAKVRAWLADRSRFHVHSTPTCASWLNQVERWFGRINQRASRRGSFTSGPALLKAIQRFVDDCKQDARPFPWPATTESILARLERAMNVIDGTSR